jgi:uncharacterized protein YcfJ
MRAFQPFLTVAVFALSASPALAQDDAPLPPLPAQAAQPAPRLAYSQEEREGWLRECRHRLGDNGVGGAVIGGVVGGVAGNRIAGRGHRVAGTIVGAGVGAVAGAAIDQGEDSARVREECESYLSRYEAGSGGGYYYGGQSQYAYTGAGYTYATAQGCTSGCGSYPVAPAGMMWVPVPTSGQGCCCQQKPKTRTIVTEEEVPETIEQAPPRVIRTKYTKVEAVPARPRPIKSIK